MKTPFLKTLRFQVVMLGLVSGLILLAVLELHSNQLQRELRRLAAAERQTLQRCQVRAQALVVAKEVSLYLERRQSSSWGELQQDRGFRELALQNLEAGGETLLLAAAQGKVFLHSRESRAGQDISEMGRWRRLTQEIHRFCRGKPHSVCELALGPDSCYSSALLVPVSRRPPGGPDLAVAALFDPGRPDNPPGAGYVPAPGRLSLDYPLEQFRPRIVLVLGILVGVWLLACLALTRRQSRQVAALLKAAEAFNAGNLDYRIPRPGTGEMGLLADTLNRMAAGLRENTVSRVEWEDTFNVIPDQVMVLDKEQRILRLNRAAATFLGIPPEAAAGRFCYEVMHGRSAPQKSCAFVQALRSGLRSQVEYCCQAGDRSFLATVDPLRDAAGETKGAVHVVRDVTAFKRIEQDLAQASQFLNQIFEATPVALAVVNRQGLFSRVNPQFFHEYGYRPDDILGMHYSTVYADEKELRGVIGELRDQGQVLGRITYFRHQSGQVVPTRISIRKLRDQEGELLGSVAVGRNISHEVSLQRQLEQAQKLEAVATLAGGLAHNFNNQMTVIMGLTSLMLTRTALGSDLHRDLQEITEQVQAGRELTQKLLTFTRSTTFKMQPLNLNDLVEVTADMFARTRRELEVVKDLSQGLLPVAADPSQIQQVLMNLLINAWQAMPGGGRLTIATRVAAVAEWTDRTWDLRPGDYATLAVADTGVGMDETVRSRIFEPFFTTKEAGQGTGLGLASAYRIIKDHGGAIRVESIAGRGSTFAVYLPLSDATPQVLAATDRRLVLGDATILVVDDEPVLRQVCARMLQKLGYRVLQAAGGKEALDLFRDRGPEVDLILLDLIMPGLDGLQTLAGLRDQDPGARVLLCSGYGDKAGDSLPPEVGFIAKPYTLEMLSQKVAAALQT